MTQTHCSLGNKAVLWEPPGQRAEGREGPWELGVGMGGWRVTLQGGQELLMEAGVRGSVGQWMMLLRCREKSRDADGSGRKCENRVYELRKPLRWTPSLADLEGQQSLR